MSTKFSHCTIGPLPNDTLQTDDELSMDGDSHSSSSPTTLITVVVTVGVVVLVAVTVCLVVLVLFAAFRKKAGPFWKMKVDAKALDVRYVCLFK